MMILDSHSQAGIAQICFYFIASILTAVLLFRRPFQAPRGYVILIVFTHIRLAGGILIIILEQEPDNVGLNSATSVLLGTGIPPLLAMAITFLRAIHALAINNKKMLFRITVYLFVLFWAAISCLIAGGTLAFASDVPSQTASGQRLLHAGIGILGGLWSALVVFHYYLWQNRARLDAPGRIILVGSSIALPFFVPRIIYAALSYSITNTGLEWSPIYGSIAAYVCMAMLTEWVIVATYIGVGMVILYTRDKKGERVYPVDVDAHKNSRPEGNSMEPDEQAGTSCLA